MSSNRLLAVVLGAAVAFTLIGGGIALRGSQRSTQVRAAKLPVIDTHKTPTCGCCSKWVDHMRQAGFEVRATDVSQEELDRLRNQRGIPAGVRSCHTAMADGYVIEGHIPAAQVKRFLAERPEAVGLAVPRMPLGSPGMEVSGMTPHPYDVLTFDKQGNTTVFATVRP